MINSGDDSFGTLLTTFRKRAHLTQQHLAEALGMHRHAISRWEQGDVFPASKAIVLELARLLHLNDQEARHLLEASLTAPVPFWGVPSPRNLFFTGREAILKTLHTYLSAEQTAATASRIVALQGLGGVGKTQVALEYAYRHALEYRAIFWIEAETPERVLFSLQRIAEGLYLPARTATDQRQIVGAVQHWLATHHHWLLIWDNVEDLEVPQRTLSPTFQGSLLLTTRRQGLGTFARGIEVPPMEREEGMLLLLRRAKMLELETGGEQVQHLAIRIPEDYTAAADLVSILGGLPLALDQAGAYLEETGCSLNDYQRRYEQQRASLLDRRGSSGGHHPQSVAATFLLALEQIEREQAMVADLLRVCALLNAEDIPEELFRHGAEHLGPALAPLADDPGQFDQAIAVLRSLSLVQRHAETHTLSLHRLVQVVLQEEMSEQERAGWLRRVITALNALFPEVISTTWRQCERLLPHVLAVAAALPNDAEDLELARVMRKAADYLRERMQYDQARSLYQRALRTWKRAPEPDAEMARPLNGLALLSSELCQYDQAEELYQQARLLLEQLQGPTHPDMFRPLNNLAILYSIQGKYTKAECLYQQALAICVQAYGPDHSWTAYALANLAEVYLEQGKDELVQPLCEQALRIWKREWGAEHSLLTTPLLTLAQLSLEQGNYPEAEDLYRQVLSIQERVLGTGHPETADVLNGLANLSARQGQNKQARQLYQQALSFREMQPSQDHPKTAQTLHDFAVFLQEQGNADEALLLIKRALEIRSRRLGSFHPKTLATQTHYAQLLQVCKETTGGRQSAKTQSASSERPLLTARQQEIVSLVAEGWSNQQIARHLILSPGTVKRHLHNISQKLEARNRTQIVTLARQRGMYDS